MVIWHSHEYPASLHFCLALPLLFSPNITTPVMIQMNINGTRISTSVQQWPFISGRRNWCAHNLKQNMYVTFRKRKHFYELMEESEFGVV